ncbi:hypothetical protein B0H11DRAFT_2130377 [Mycena galericulata]|nr:hypothetical protein B0H11DRAFT_2130377 [Mycena galericulata]
MSQPPYYPPAPNSATYPGGYQQSPGGFAPPPGQVPYASPGYPPSMPGAPYPPSMPGPGYPPPQPPPAHSGYAPQYLPPSPQGYPGSGGPPMPGLSSPGFPSYAPPPGAPPAGYPSYAPPAGYGAPQGYSGYAPPQVAFPGFQGSAEPPTVLYRDITIHNPKFSGGLHKYQGIDVDVTDIVKHSNTKDLINVLARMGPLKMEVVAQEFPSNTPKNESLYDFVKRKTSGDIQRGLLGLILGPLKYDVDRIHDAITGAGTKEDTLNEIILSLTPQDLSLLTHLYQQKYGKALLQDIHGEFNMSGDVKKLFDKVLDPNRRLLPDSSTPDGTRLVMDDVETLYKSGQGRVGTKESKFYEILTGRTHYHLIQVCRVYLEKHKKSLSHVIHSEFSGDDRKALLSIVMRSDPDLKHLDVDPAALRDARLLEETMAGLGTREALLVMRLLRAHWSRPRMDGINAAYLRIYQKTLQKRVAGETSGTLENLLLSLLKGPTTY